MKNSHQTGSDGEHKTPAELEHTANWSNKRLLELVAMVLARGGAPEFGTIHAAAKYAGENDHTAMCLASMFMKRVIRAEKEALNARYAGVDLGPLITLDGAPIRFSDLVDWYDNEALNFDTDDYSDPRLKRRMRKYFPTVPAATMDLARDVAAQQRRDDDAKAEASHARPSG